MKVILTSNIKKLGKVGDLVNVKDGFARNYLFPQKKALRNTKNNLEQFENIKKDIIAKESQKRKDAENILKKLDGILIKFVREADDKGQLYGSVTLKEIYNFLLEKDIKIDPDDILINQPIKSIGEHSVRINPYESLTKDVNVVVTS